MEGRYEAKEYYTEYLRGVRLKQFVALASRCMLLASRLYEKHAGKVELNDNERFTLYVGLPKNKDKWIPIMVEIANAHPQKVSHLVEWGTTVIKVAMVDGIKEAYIYEDEG